MNEVNKRRSQALGMPMGTANSQIRKILLFDCLKRLDEDTCYRCGTKIVNIEDLSIEHKKSWLYSDNPKELFFDLNNISFSHIICNVSASKTYENGKHPAQGKPSPRKGLVVEAGIKTPDGMSWCRIHKEFLPVINFHKDDNASSGYKDMCKPCRRDYRQERYRLSQSR